MLGKECIRSVRITELKSTDRTLLRLAHVKLAIHSTNWYNTVLQAWLHAIATFGPLSDSFFLFFYLYFVMDADVSAFCVKSEKDTSLNSYVRSRVKVHHEGGHMHCLCYYSGNWWHIFMVFNSCGILLSLVPKAIRVFFFFFLETDQWFLVQIM